MSGNVVSGQLMTGPPPPEGAPKKVKETGRCPDGWRQGKEGGAVRPILSKKSNAHHTPELGPPGLTRLWKSSARPPRRKPGVARRRQSP